MADTTYEGCCEGEFPVHTFHIHFYMPVSEDDDVENQRLSDSLAKEKERFRAVAEDLVHAYGFEGRVRVGIQ